ncbi:MAG: hypothetical protein Q9217_003382 [Psora testacea]
MAIGIAILGAGKHLPAIQLCPDFSLKAIYSPVRTAAEGLATDANVEAYFDSPKPPGRALSALLAREDVQAVTIALPIPVQPTIIREVLEAGKHVLSEGPITDNVAGAEDLLEWHRKQSGNTLWSVGENFRFMEPVLYARHKLREIAGNVEIFSVKLHGSIDKSGHSFPALWQQDHEHQGGFLLDGGIHSVAALHFLLSAVSTSITQVAAFTSLVQPNLSPVHTANATIHLDNGNSGTFSISYGSEFANAFEVRIVTGQGAVTLMPTRVTVLTRNDDHNVVTVTRDFPADSGVKRELAVYAKGIEAGKIDPRGTPEEALMDLKVMQGILESGEEGGIVKAVTQYER